MPCIKRKQETIFCRGLVTDGKADCIVQLHCMTGCDANSGNYFFLLIYIRINANSKNLHLRFSFNSYVFTLPDGGHLWPDDSHLGFRGQNDVITSTLYQNRNPRGSYRKKCLHTLFFALWFKSKFFGICQRPFWIWLSGGKCQHFFRGTGGAISFLNGS